jgi:hypothetical protein
MIGISEAYALLRFFYQRFECRHQLQCDKTSPGKNQKHDPVGMDQIERITRPERADRVAYRRLEDNGAQDRAIRSG